MLGLALSTLAPFQCAHTPDPDDRREDTAGDALWGLAEEFRAHQNEQASRDTLQYLVARYPSNRHAPEARAKLSAAATAASPDGG